jgi:hypothetical protein
MFTTLVGSGRLLNPAVHISFTVADHLNQTCTLRAHIPRLKAPHIDCHSRRYHDLIKLTITPTEQPYIAPEAIPGLSEYFYPIRQVAANFHIDPASMSEPPQGTLIVPCSKDSYKIVQAHVLKPIYNAKMITSYIYSDTTISVDYYRWVELVEEGRWDWTKGQVGHDDSVNSAMPSNDSIKLTCPPDAYDECTSLLEGLVNDRVIGAFLYDDDGTVRVDYYHWEDLAAWGPWDHMRDQRAEYYPESVVKSEAEKEYIRSLQGPPKDGAEQKPHAGEEPPRGEVRVPLPKDFWLAHFHFVKALFQASMLTRYGYDGKSKKLCIGFYRYLELVEEGRWDWTENQVGYEDTDSSSMPPNETLKYPCSSEVYTEYIPVLEALLKARAINGFSYDDDDGNICVDYYPWQKLATWGPWDGVRDQMVVMEPEYAMESETGRRYLASWKKASGDEQTSGTGVDPAAATE